MLPVPWRVLLRCRIVLLQRPSEGRSRGRALPGVSPGVAVLLILAETGLGSLLRMMGRASLQPGEFRLGPKAALRQRHQDRLAIQFDVLRALVHKRIRCV